MSLTNAQFGLLQRNIDAVVERIAVLNLNLVIEHDFYELLNFLEAIPGMVVNPTFDPRISDLSKDSFWFRIVDEDGVTVASHADKVFEGDFYELIENCSLWYRDGLSHPHAKRLQLLDRPVPPVAGRLGYSGSMWIHPEHRKKGLSLYLPYLSRALCIRNYETDYHTGMVFKALARSELPSAAYGYPHVRLCLKGYFPPTQKDEEMYACYISRDESFEQIYALASHPHYPVAA